jgi:hypothetical protein
MISVVVPNSVTTIGPGAFSGCPSLTGVYFEGNAPTVSPSGGRLASNATVYYLAGTTGWGPTFGRLPTVLWDPQVPFTYTTNKGAITITGYTGPSGSVTIPDTINGLPVTSIRNVAFQSCNTVTSVTIGDGVTNIGNGAFEYCTNLASATIGIGVVSIGRWAFSYCTSLGDVTIPNSVTNIGLGAFSDCTGLSSVTIPNSVTSLGQSAFADCANLKGVTIGNGVTRIEDYTFSGCIGLEGVSIPSGVTGIGTNAFSFCSTMTNVTIPESVTSIGDEAFLHCTSLCSITIPDSVASIGNVAFGSCSNLASATIGVRVTSIGDWAFSHCGSLTGVYFKGNAPVLDSGIFFDGGNPTVYYLPGTTGWESSFAGSPTAVWRPLIQTSTASFSPPTNRFGFTITWAGSMTVAVDACTNLANPVWSPLATNKLTSGSAYFSDPQWTSYPARFYRLRWP